MGINRPTLLVDLGKCEKNLKKIQAKASASGTQLRPHFKTHHSAELAEIYRKHGVTACTVSSVSMAAYFSANGWNDLTIAFPFNPLEADVINSLSERNNINIFLESVESLHLAEQKLKQDIGYYIKIDVGSHRTGIDPRNTSLIQKILANASENLRFKGFYAHAGHTYGCNDLDSVQWIFDKAKKELMELKKQFGGTVCFGDTPSCSLMTDFDWCDELSPGNFFFYDWMQHQIGSCKAEEIAVCLAAPIVALHRERSEVVVHAGAVHLSKDSVTDQKHQCFGKAVRLAEGGWETEIIGSMSRLSQEHGIIRIKKDYLEQVEIGDLIGILPIHACLAADLQGHYLSTSGNRIEKMNKN